MSKQSFIPPTVKIWELLLYILEIAEIISADAGELFSAVIDVNPKFHKIYLIRQFEIPVLVWRY